MDIGRFVDSAAIRAYLKEQNYPFSAQEAAFLVYHCKTASLEERVRAWEEIIRTMGDGLLAASMGGGSVNPLTGEFNFAVDEGYWVKNGTILCPVRGATLIGKGHEVLLNIDRVGRDMWMAPGMCGSVSGSVPTNVGQPRIRVSSITVGGKGGAL